MDKKYVFILLLSNSKQASQLFRICDCVWWHLQYVHNAHFITTCSFCSSRLIAQFCILGAQSKAANKFIALHFIQAKHNGVLIRKKLLCMTIQSSTSLYPLRCIACVLVWLLVKDKLQYVSGNFSSFLLSLIIINLPLVCYSFRKFFSLKRRACQFFSGACTEYWHQLTEALHFPCKVTNIPSRGYLCCGLALLACCVACVWHSAMRPWC